MLSWLDIDMVNKKDLFPLEQGKSCFKNATSMPEKSMNLELKNVSLFLSCHICILSKSPVSYSLNIEESFILDHVWYVKCKIMQQYLNPQPLSLQTNTRLIKHTGFVWLNIWIFTYELTGGKFESHYRHKYASNR